MRILMTYPQAKEQKTFRKRNLKRKPTHTLSAVQTPHSSQGFITTVQQLLVTTHSQLSRRTQLLQSNAFFFFLLFLRSRLRTMALETSSGPSFASWSCSLALTWMVLNERHRMRQNRAKKVRFIIVLTEGERMTRWIF